jgi:hypothetical protein
MSRNILRKALERGAIIDRSVEDDMHTIPRQTLDLEKATDEEIVAFAEMTQSQSFEEWLDASAERLAADLIAEGWPHPGATVLVSTDGWRERPPEADDGKGSYRKHVRPGEAIWVGWAYVQKHATELEPAWFRAELYKIILELRSHDGQDRDWAIFKLGHTHAVARSRAHKPSVSRGKKTKRSASDGGKARANRKAVVRHNVLKEMQRVIDEGKSISCAARIAKKRGFGTGTEANRSLWYRSRNSRKRR